MEPYIIVPVKRLSDSKTRLAPILDAQERQMLSIHMFEDVMTAVGDTRSFSCTVLIGPDDPTSMIARVYGARFLR